MLGTLILAIKYSGPEMTYIIPTENSLAKIIHGHSYLNRNRDIQYSDELRRRKISSER